MRNQRLIVGLAAFTVAPLAVKGATLAQDNYLISQGQSGQTAANGYYNAGSSLASQGAVTPLGFGTGTGGTGTAQYQSQTGPLTNALVNTPPNGGKVGYVNPGVTTLTRSTAHNLTAPANNTSSGTYYESFLVNEGTWTAGTATATARSLLTGCGNAVVPLSNGSTGSATVRGIFVGFAQDGSAAQLANGGNLTLRYNAGGTMSDIDMLDGTTGNVQNITHLVIAKITTTATDNGDETINWWLDPTNATSDATLTTSAANFGVVTNATAYGNAGTDFVRLNYYSQGWGSDVAASGFFDNPTVSTDLAGLNLASVPEPTTLAFTAIAGLGLLRRRSVKR